MTRRELMGNLAILVLIVVVVYGVVTLWSNSSGPGYVPPALGSPITVNLGPPVVSSITCGSGASASEERIPWINSTQPLTTGEVFLAVYEIWDHDFYGDGKVVLNVTATNVCAGAPPTPASRWYAVLANPNGTNVLTYTEDSSWASVVAGSTNLTIEDNSSLILITNPPVAGTGFGLSVLGFVNGSEVSGSVVL